MLTDRQRIQALEAAALKRLHSPTWRFARSSVRLGWFCYPNQLTLNYTIHNICFNALITVMGDRLARFSVKEYMANVQPR